MIPTQLPHTDLTKEAGAAVLLRGVPVKYRGAVAGLLRDVARPSGPVQAAKRKLLLAKLRAEAHVTAAKDMLLTGNKPSLGDIVERRTGIPGVSPGALGLAGLVGYVALGRAKKQAEEIGLPIPNAIEKISQASPPQENLSGVLTMKPWFKPFPHQEDAWDRFEDNGGKLIMAHATGTGKTGAAVFIAEKQRQLGKSTGAVVVVPAGLRVNFAEGGVGKFTTADYQIIGGSSEKTGGKVVRIGAEKKGVPFTVVGYELFARDPEGIMARTGANTLICDEFHKIRTETTHTYKALFRARQMASNFIGLTASPINNSPAEIATLLTISEGRRMLTPRQFRARYMATVDTATGFTGGVKAVRGLKDSSTGDLLENMYGKIHYVDTEDVKGNVLPKKDLKNVEVPMSDEQYRLYNLALKRVGRLREMMMRRDTNITVKDAQQLIAQISEARKISNSLATGLADKDLRTASYETPKARRVLDDAVEHLKANPKHQVVLYSNLINGGVDVLEAGLRDRGIDPAVFVGKDREIGGKKITSAIRDEGVREYQAGKKRAIILSGAGAEGLDLKDSTAFFALDGHFNPERILQAEARARRLGGQAYKPEAERSVDVRRYMNTVPESEKPGFFGRLIGRKAPMTVDEWMYGVAGQKYKQTGDLLQKVRAPHKYISKYRVPGGWRYIYPKASVDGVKDGGFEIKDHAPQQQKSLWRRLFWK